MFRHRLVPYLLACLLAGLAPASVTADDATEPVSVLDLGWIAGQWRGEKGDSVVEEQWSALGGGAMMGMFRWFTDDEVRLYEFLLIESSPKGPVLRIKHFGPGLRGWEEKDESLEFHLVDLQDGKAIFEMDPEIETTRLIYTQTAGGGLEVQLIKTKDGKESITAFVFERQ